MFRVTPRNRGSWLVAVAVIVSAGCVLSAQSPQTVLVKPGQDLQEIVENAPQGTRFRFEPGVYRQQTLYPKNQQEFIGGDGVILSGALELRSWTKQSGLWQHGDLSQSLPFHGECEDGGDLCKLREDLFVNGRLYERVASLDELGPRRWYYEDRRAYLADDPTGQLVELGVTPLAFGGDAEGVVLQDLIIEKYASDSQHGAIYVDDTRGWRLSNVTARWNHGAGLSFGPETLVKGGSFSHNGQVGILGIGEGARIEGVEIAFNNYAGYDAQWEAGGAKFWRNKRLVVQNSCVHHNNGPGLWSDIDNVGVVFDDNKVFMNADDGIKFEISYGAIIRNNVVAYNGTSGFDDWLWGSQILIQNGSNVRVYGNLVEVSSKFGNGIGVIHQDRGHGAYGPWNAVNNLIEHNTIVHLGKRGESGVVTDTDDENWFWKEADNRFDANTYIVPDGGSAYWTSKDGNEVWDDLRDLGFERNGKLIVEQRVPTELSCDG